MDNVSKNSANNLSVVHAEQKLERRFAEEENLQLRVGQLKDSSRPSLKKSLIEQRRNSIRSNISALQVCLPQETAVHHEELKGSPFVAVEISRTANRGRFELDSNQPSEAQGLHGLVTNGEALSALSFKVKRTELRTGVLNRLPWPITMDEADAYRLCFATCTIMDIATTPHLLGSEGDSDSPDGEYENESESEVEHMGSIIVIAIVLARYGCSSNKMFSKWNLLRHEAVQGVEFRFTALDDGKAYERSSADEDLGLGQARVQGLIAHLDNSPPPSSHTASVRVNWKTSVLIIEVCFHLEFIFQYRNIGLWEVRA
ncbi:uncharacterized protein LACBIDRAFT_322050 [Laccaria bicolor S238N-H82]|uniref:Predicted protein n=1 Tax=Laccaria bicolor (strain S238N-H82 / ATCC MYA-4686) TaxID=486041 RepID=B0CRZ0_LACBS|nr:uncharacterized protein LACBIDRAFT_322050 [Laccaria bicolor S238N-H82]EDR14203.1 predicted protein [Laccaria bicolor S238N-H82]|eukprot:XP_001874762.1 predicted protein [Laccaria bicolor S238N-H82]